eukprot:TRINITY_DN2165_c0_g1_i11.p2 TRINITY_DN2165_c0_g1~~TRINITY_DN2165_c0_g1_i11.p2  ORF type:complete len:147 (-),score=14.38 TRINITY_DN2165_c0_g1_i11:1656-2096(-)
MCIRDRYQRRVHGMAFVHRSEYNMRQAIKKDDLPGPGYYTINTPKKKPRYHFILIVEGDFHLDRLRKEKPMGSLTLHLVACSNKIGPGYYKQHGQFEVSNKKKDEEKSVAKNEQEVLAFLKPTPTAFNVRAERFKPNLPIQEGPGE